MCAHGHGMFYGKMRFAEQKITFYSDKFRLATVVNRRAAMRMCGRWTTRTGS